VEVKESHEVPRNSWRTSRRLRTGPCQGTELSRGRSVFTTEFLMYEVGWGVQIYQKEVRKLVTGKEYRIQSIAAKREPAPKLT